MAWLICVGQAAAKSRGRGGRGGRGRGRGRAGRTPAASAGAEDDRDEASVPSKRLLDDDDDDGDKPVKVRATGSNPQQVLQELRELNIANMDLPGPKFVNKSLCLHRSYQP